MEGIIDAFGLDLRLIILQLFNFGIMLGILGYLLYKPILKLLADREAKIAQGLRDAEEAEASKKQANEDRKQVLEGAQKEAEAIVGRATTAATKEASEIVKKADDEAARALNNAREQAANLKLQAEKESEGEIAKLAILATEKLLKEKAQ